MKVFLGEAFEWLVNVSIYAFLTDMTARVADGASRDWARLLLANIETKYFLVVSVKGSIPAVDLDNWKGR